MHPRRELPAARLPGAEHRHRARRTGGPRRGLSRPARRGSAGGDERQRGCDHGAGAAQLGGLLGIATVGRAVGLERAEVAQPPGVGPEVVALARLGDGRCIAVVRRSTPMIDWSVGVAMIASGFDR